MFLRQTSWKVATALLVLPAVVGAALVPPAGAARQCAQSLVASAPHSARPACAGDQQPCCCGTAAVVQACHCQQQKPAAPAPLPDDSGRTLKTAPWIAAAWAAAAIAERALAALPAADHFYSPVQRSLQSLFCVWLI